MAIGMAGNAQRPPSRGSAVAVTSGIRRQSDPSGPTGTGDTAFFNSTTNLPELNIATNNASEIVVGSGVTTELSINQVATGDNLYLYSSGTSVDTSAAGSGGFLVFGCSGDRRKRFDLERWRNRGDPGGSFGGQLEGTHTVTKTGAGYRSGANNRLSAASCKFRRARLGSSIPPAPTPAPPVYISTAAVFPSTRIRPASACPRLSIFWGIITTLSTAATP